MIEQDEDHLFFLIASESPAQVIAQNDDASSSVAVEETEVTPSALNSLISDDGDGDDADVPEVAAEYEAALRVALGQQEDIVADASERNGLLLRTGGGNSAVRKDVENGGEAREVRHEQDERQGVVESAHRNGLNQDGSLLKDSATAADTNNIDNNKDISNSSSGSSSSGGSSRKLSKSREQQPSPIAVVANVGSNAWSLANPIMQAAHDVGCGFFVALMISTKIFTFAIVDFQADSTVQLRAGATSAAAMGSIFMAVVMMCFSRFPFVVVVPDMFSAPFLIQMSFALSNRISDPDDLNVSVLVLYFSVFVLSGILHVLMSHFRLLRFLEFLPYPVFCGLFSAVGLLIVRRSVEFAPGYQIIPSMLVGITLSLKVFKNREVRPYATFVATFLASIVLFYLVVVSLGLTVADIREIGWLVPSPFKGSTAADYGTHLVPWFLWINDSKFKVRFDKVQWVLLLDQCQTSALLIILIALRRSMQFANLNKLFSSRAKSNRELALHGYAQILAVVGLGTFGGMLSGPDMVRVKRMHGGELFPGCVAIAIIVIFTMSNFQGVDFVPTFVYAGIFASEGFMMLERFLLMPYKQTSQYEWLAVVVIAITAFFDMFNGFFIGMAISIFLFSYRFYRMRCVKLTGTGLTIRSTVDRGDVTADWLSSHGEKIRIVQLRGTIAFANVTVVLDVVEDMLEMNSDKTHPERTPQGRFLLWFAILKSRLWSTCRRWMNSGSSAQDRRSLINSSNVYDGDVQQNNVASLPSPPLSTESSTESSIAPLPPPSFPRSKSKAQARVALASLFVPPTSSELQLAQSSDAAGGEVPLSASRFVSFSNEAPRSSSSPPPAPADDFFSPEFLILDAALVIFVDASALDTFKQIRDYCDRKEVELCLSGMEPHLDLLEKSGIFPRKKRFADLDTALSSCEDKLLVRHGIGSEYRANSPSNEAEATRTGGREEEDEDANYEATTGFFSCLEMLQDRHQSIDHASAQHLRTLVNHVKPLKFREGDVIMNTAQGSAISLDEDGLFFIESGCITVQRDPNQSVALTVRSSRRKRMSVAPQVARLKHRTFQLSRLGPGWVLGVTELCSRYRSMGQYVVQSRICRAHFLSFRTIRSFEREQPLLALKVFQLSSLVLADRFDRSKEQLSHLSDMIYAPPHTVSTAAEKALKKQLFLAATSGSV